MICNFNKSKQAILFTVVLIVANVFINTLLAQENMHIKELYLQGKSNYMQGFNYVEFNSSDIKDNFDAEKSSKYPSVNLFDGYFKTCWVAGNTKTKKSFSLYVNVPKNIDIDKLILNVFSGYGKSKKLYYANARPKEIKLTIYSGFGVEELNTEVMNFYLINKFASKTLNLDDVFKIQSFPLDINKEIYNRFQNKTKNRCKAFLNKNHSDISNKCQLKSSTILKIDILDSYLGSLYSDICISEIFFNNRFVTKCPNVYNEIEDVYIENDNALLMDYKNRKRIVVFKDTSAVFTMVDYIPKSNWAILHYVSNDESGSGSRSEEMYKLFDLKNKRTENVRLNKCTGQSPLLLEKCQDGKILLTTFDDNFKIELR